MVDTNGIITAIAGNGVDGYSGDGGHAAEASFGAQRLTIDPVGNLIITDNLINRVRKVHLAGDPTLTQTNLTTINAGSYASLSRVRLEASPVATSR